MKNNFLLRLILALSILASCSKEVQIVPDNMDLNINSQILTEKVIICHNGVTISIDENALDAHVNHGDFIGECLNDKTYVPDDKFEQRLIKLGYDDILDNYVLTANIANVQEIYLSEGGISNLTGIEDFSSLTILFLESSPIEMMDISKNIALEELWIRNNELTTLDITHNVNLKIVRCNENRLTNIDLSKNFKLELFKCVFNNISHLDTSNLTNLKELSCGSNNLTELDVSLNKNLEILDFADNQLTTIDVRKNPELNTLYCFRNPMKSIDVRKNLKLAQLACFNTEISKLDLCNNYELIFLQCQNNPYLTSLDLKNGNNPSIDNADNSFIANNNPNLFCIEVDDAAYSTENWMNNDHWAGFSEDCSD